MLNAILVLARARLLIVRNTFWRGRLINKIGSAALLVLIGLGAWGVYSLMAGAVAALSSPRFAKLLAEAARQSPEAGIPSDVAPFLAALPSTVLFAALLMLVFTSFGTVLSSLYLAGDLDMLVAAPVPMRAVFVVKLLGGLATPYLLLFALLGPALLGYGAGMGYGPAYPVALVAVLLLFPLLPAGIGALLVMAVVRVVPARRAREIVSLLGGLLGVGWYVLSQLSPQIAPRLSSVRTLDGLRRLDVPLLPSAWAGRALVAAGEGAWLTLLAYGGLFAALALGVFAACLLAAERLYYAGWANMAVQGGRVKTKNQEPRTKNQVPGANGRATGQRSAAGSGGSRLWALSAALPPPAAAVVFKDLRVFPRDLRNLQQVIFPLAVAAIWSIQLLTGGELREALGSAGGVVGAAGISFFVCLSLSTALGGPSVSREGRGFWILKAAPVRARDILLGKLAIAYLPFPTVGALFVTLLAWLQHATPGEWLAALALVALVGLGASAISLGIGAAFPRFNWETPQQQSTIQAGCLSPILYMTYIALAGLLAIGLPALAEAFAPGWAVPATIVGWLALLALTAGVSAGAIGFGAARLERVEV